MNLASQHVPFLQLLLSKLKFRTSFQKLCYSAKRNWKQSMLQLIQKIIIHTFLKNFYHLSKLWQVGKVMAGKRIQQSLKDQEQSSGIWLSFKKHLLCLKYYSNILHWPMIHSNCLFWTQLSPDLKMEVTGRSQWGDFSGSLPINKIRIPNTPSFLTFLSINIYSEML